MTLHYHGTPITPTEVILTLAGRLFCVSFARPDQVELVHRIGQGVMLDNGAFSLFTTGKPTDWPGYYAWVDRWFEHPNTWAVIPDQIDAGSQQQDSLITEWPHGHRGAPVWHMDEPISRLLRLVDEWPRVCVGSTGDYWQIRSHDWTARMDDMWNEVAKRHARLPWLHMLRGMQLSRMEWPFASLDSTDIARNHNRVQNTARLMADRWDAAQCPPRWAGRHAGLPLQLSFV